MGTIYLIRHGQASLGAADYDQLSALGQQQAQRLGQYLAGKGIVPSAVFMGSLRRQAQTWEGIAQGLRASGLSALPQPEVRPGLNEYDGAAVIRSVSCDADAHAPPTTPEAVRAHFRRLRTGLLQWARGTSVPEGMPPYPDFAQAVAGALAEIQAGCSGDVLVVSSGGPIGTAVALTLGAPAEAFVELNMRIRNTAVTELLYTRDRRSLQTFNALAHLDAPEFADWITYA